MQMRSINLFLTLFLSILLGSPLVWALPRPVTTGGPVITHAFAPKVEKYGDPMRFYIEADDPASDMLRVAIVVDQVGYGHYPTDWVFLPRNDEHHFAGYLQWNTFSSHAATMPEWTELTVKISVFDTSGQESNTVAFPVEFVSEARPKVEPPAPFNTASLQKLGYVDINLYNPLEQGEEFERER